MVWDKEICKEWEDAHTERRCMDAQREDGWDRVCIGKRGLVFSLSLCLFHIPSPSIPPPLHSIAGEVGLQQRGSFTDVEEGMHDHGLFLTFY